MSESNNNIPMRITQLEEATEYPDGAYYPIAKFGWGTKKISCDVLQPEVQLMSDYLSELFKNELFKTVPNEYVMFPYEIKSGDELVISSDNLVEGATVYVYARVTEEGTSTLLGTINYNQNTLNYKATTNFNYIRLMAYGTYLVKVTTLNYGYNLLTEKVEKTNENMTFSNIQFANSDSDWIQYNLGVPSTGATTIQIVSSNTRICTKIRYPFDVGSMIKFTCPSGTKYRALFFAKSGELKYPNNYQIITNYTDDPSTWHTDSRELIVPTGAKAVAVAVAFTNDASITPSTRPEGFKMEFVPLAERVEEIEQQLENIVPYEEYKNKRISILGDSISTFAGEDAESAGDGHTIADGTYTYAGNHCRYPNSYLSNVDQTYWKMLIDNLEMNLGVNDSWAGSRVSWNGSESSDQGANIYIASQTRINHLDDNGTPDYILVNAGTNDIGQNVAVGTFNTENPVNYTAEEIAALSVATFADAYRALLIRLQKTYPLARIVVMLPNYTTSYYNPTNADKYLEIIKEACDFFGVPWVDMRTTGITMYNTGTYTGDGIHPNPSGMTLLYNKLDKFFKYSL